MKTIACSIVGLGRIASLLEDDPLREKPATHAGAIAANNECSLLSGCDPDPERRRLFSQRWGCSNVADDMDGMLEFGKPDIFIVATPPAMHASSVFRAIREKIPLVICEKPLAGRVQEARKIVTAAAHSDTVLMVNHERRYSRDYVGLRTIVSEKKYGRLLSIHARLYMGHGGTVRSMFYEDGTHLIDIIRFITGGEFTRIRATGDVRSKNGAMIVTAHAADTPLVIEAACDRDHLVFELDLSFESGRVRIGNGLYEEYASAPSPYYEKFKSLVKKVDNIYTSTGYFTGMIADAVNVCKSVGSIRPVSSGLDGLVAVKTIAAILDRVHRI